MEMDISQVQISIKNSIVGVKKKGTEK